MINPKNFIILALLAVVLTVTAPAVSGVTAEKEYFRSGGSLWFGIHSDDSLYRDLDYARLGFQLRPETRWSWIRLLTQKIDSGSVVAIHFSHEAEITTVYGLGTGPGWGSQINEYPPVKTLSGWHTIKIKTRRDYYSISLRFITPGMLYYGYRMVPLTISSIAIQQPGSTSWQEISGFVPPANPYAKPEDMVNKTASFMEALVDTSIFWLRWYGDTRAFYALKSDCGLAAGDTLIIYGPSQNENDPDAIGQGVVRAAPPGSKWPLELSVVWPGDYNPKNLYRVRAWRINRQPATPTSVATNDTGEPISYGLGQNYPNPFNPTTTIPFSLTKSGDVALTIFNLGGQLVRTLINDQLPAGQHELLWDGRDDLGRLVPSGIYLVRLVANGQVGTKKITLAK